MSAGLIRLAQQVVSRFPVSAGSVTLVHAAESKAVWKISGQGRKFGLKRLKSGKNEALFAIQAQNYINDQGGPVPSLIRDRNDQLYAEQGGEMFVLYNWVEGRRPSFGEAADLRQAVRMLARFHQASSGFRPELPCRESSKLGKWPGQYETMKRHFREWQGNSAFPKLSSAVKPYWNDLMRLSAQALDDLKKSDYDKMSADSHSGLCHQDYSEGNVLLTRESGTVIDLDSVTFDFPARDLRKLILKRMQARGKWDTRLFRQMMDWYQEVYPLTAQQLHLVRVDISFPHLFHETAKNPFRNRSAVPLSKLLAAARIELDKEIALSKWL